MKVVVQDGVRSFGDVRGSLDDVDEADVVIGLDGDKAHVLKDRFGVPRACSRAAGLRLARQRRSVS